MKHIQHFFCYAVFVAVSLSFAACSNDEPSFTFNDNNEPSLEKCSKISLDDFNKYAVGHGWNQVETHRIKDNGSIEKEEYWKDRDGGGPSYYEFRNGSITQYFWADAIPALAFWNENMTYDESSNTLHFNGNKYFKIIQINKKTIKCIICNGVTDDGNGGVKNVYLYVTLQRMTDDELNSVKETYKYDYSQRFNQ